MHEIKNTAEPLLFLNNQKLGKVKEKIDIFESLAKQADKLDKQSYKQTINTELLKEMKADVNKLKIDVKKFKEISDINNKLKNYKVFESFENDFLKRVELRRTDG